MTGEITRKTYERLFRARLRQMREEAGYAVQADFARACGISPRNYEKYENRSMLPLYFVPNVAKVLSKSVWEIITGTEREPPRGNVAPLKAVSHPTGKH